jgi:hydroxyethylthiazole kinase
MKLALKAATAQRLPIVLDPVGAGATDYRTRTCHDLLALARPTIIRGNASEIMALVDTGMRTRGVDSVTDRDPAQAARTLARQFSCVVVVSGAVDLVTDGDASIRITNGHPLMPKVTGLGCTASALTGAFAAVRDQPLKAAAHAMAVMGICGEIAAQRAAGPGSLQTGFIDELYGLNEKKIGGYLKG